MTVVAVPERVVSVAVACRNASGSADLPLVRVTIPEDDYALGGHYDVARLTLKNKGFEGPFVCFDEQEFQPLITAVRAANDVTLTSANGTKKLDVLVVGRNASGEPDALVVAIEVDEPSYSLGQHYDLAQEKAELEGYEGPFVCFDDAELPAAKNFAQCVQPEVELVAQGKDAALIAMYLSKGFLGHGLSAEEVDQWQGESTALSWVAEFVPAVYAVEQRAELDGFEFPGVFSYEVTEPMGEWLRQNPDVNNAAFMDELASKTEAFFGQNCSALLQAAIPNLPAGYMPKGYTPPAQKSEPEMGCPSP